jgi:hypothetical protein
MVGCGSLPHRAELACNDLRLPFGIKRDAEDGLALVAQELQDRQSSLGRFIASAQGLNNNVGSSFALRALANHGMLLWGSLRTKVGSQLLVDAEYENGRPDQERPQT